MKGQKTSFVLLNFKEHPLGRQILALCLQSGFVPSLIIEEDSSLATKKTAYYQACLTKSQKLGNRKTLPHISKLVEDHKIPYQVVDHINGETCQNELEKLKPDLIILGNCRILKPAVFKTARHGCINVHPGLLPEIRGAHPIVWSILEGVSIGSTSHFIDEGVDTGQIIDRLEVPIEAGDTIESLVEKNMAASAELALKALKDFQTGTLKSQEQDLSVGKCFSWPDDATIERARAVLGP